MLTFRIFLVGENENVAEYSFNHLLQVKCILCRDLMFSAVMIILIFCEIELNCHAYQRQDYNANDHSDLTTGNSG